MEKKKDKTNRILQIVGSIKRGSGVANVVFNWHNYIDVSEIQFDYLTFFPLSENDFDKEIIKLGGRIYQLPHPYKYPLKFLLESYRFFKEHHYRVIHSHITHLNIFFFPLAKMFGTKNIIQHSHLTKWSEKKLNGLRNYLMLHAVWPLITHKMACSYIAGVAYFGKNFTVVNNGIDIEKFIYNRDIRVQKRKELGIENNFVIGHIGRFSIQKNHTFLLDILEILVKIKRETKLVLVGNGPLEEQIDQLVQAKHLRNNVILLGSRADVSEIYQAFDCFVLPSLYEGLGIVAIEAQATGLPCVLADTLPKEAFICNYKKLPLSSAKRWAEEIINFTKDFKRTNTYEQIEEAGFSAREIAKKIQKFYFDI